MSTSETDIATSAFDPTDLSKQTKQITKENTETERTDRKLFRESREDKISEKEGVKVNDVRLAAVNEVKQSENSSAEMPNKTAPSRRIPHLHKLEK